MEGIVEKTGNSPLYVTGVPDVGIYREAKTILIMSGKTGYDGYADIIAKERVKRVKESRVSNGEVHFDSEEYLTATEGEAGY